MSFDHSQYYAREETPPVGHQAFGRAAITKVLLPTDPLNAQYAIANALIAIYGAINETNDILSGLLANQRQP
jgi:hypothetical protein